MCLTIKCASDDTILNLGSVLYLAAVLLNTGSNNNAIKNVEITFTVTEHSYPSASTPRLFTIATDAFSTTTSSLGNPSARLQNARTLSKLVKSSSQTSTAASSRPAMERRMSAFAASPLVVLRTARMVRAALRRVKCRAASRPMPVLAPVTMMVWPVKSCLG